MSIYSKILVVADINHDEQQALARAMQLAQKSTSTSHVTFFLSIYDFSYDMTSMLSLEERDAMRKGVIHQREQWMRSIANLMLINPFSLRLRLYGTTGLMKQSLEKSLPVNMTFLSKPHANMTC